MKKSTVKGEMAGAASALNTMTNNVKMANTEPFSLNVLGINILSKVFYGITHKTIRSRTFVWALAGDVLGTMLYQTLVGGAKKGLWWRGSLVGLITGIGAELLPRRLGVSVEQTNRTLNTKLKTIGWYLIGTIAASAVAKMINADKVADKNDRLMRTDITTPVHEELIK